MTRQQNPVPRDTLHHMTLTFPGSPSLCLARVMPVNDDPWGLFAVLKGTPWEQLIATVSGASLSHAVRGYMRPILAELGPPPNGLIRKLPVGHKVCAHKDDCPIATVRCVPGPKLPECWDSAGLSDLAKPAATAVALAWRDGFHVVVVIGPERV